MVFPSTIETMAASSFADCGNLQAISIPKTIAEIPVSCFQNDGSLKQVDILTEDEMFLNTSAFQNCGNLVSFNFPNNIKKLTIGQYPFRDCVKLGNEEITKIASYPNVELYQRAFAYLNGITDVTIYRISSYCFDTCANLRKVTILHPNSNGDFGSYCFPSCSNLQIVVLPDDATIINANMFSSNTNLKTINIPKSLISIGAYAFQDCKGLTVISLPESTQTIDQYAFYGCSNITDFYIDKVRNTLPVPENKWNSNSNAKVHWKSFMLTYTFAPNLVFPSKLFIEGIEITEENKNEIDYLAPIMNYVAYNPDYIPQKGQLDLPEPYQMYNLNVIFNNDSTACKLIIVPMIADSKITLSYDDFTCENNYVVVPRGTTVSYKVFKAGYSLVKDEITVMENMTLNIEQVESPFETITFVYPFTDEYGFLTNFIDGKNFIIDEASQSIMNGSTSYNVGSGTSYGYISFKTPNEIGAEDTLKLSVTTSVSSEGNYDVGGVYLGTQIYRPNNGQMRNGNTDGNGKYVMRGSGTVASQTYTETLQTGQTYYLSFAYTKDGSGNSGSDRFQITNISFDCEIS